MMDGGADADRISGLPDDVLLCILSRLDMKEALATRFLSKTWEEFWERKKYFRDLTILDFNMDNIAHFLTRNNGRDLFINFVYRVIHYRDVIYVPRLEFRLYDYGLQLGDLPRVSGWVRYAVLCLVQTLVLGLSGRFPLGNEDGFRFPIISPTLRRLRIYLDTPDDFEYCSELTLVIGAPNLEYLQIDDLILASYEIQEPPPSLDGAILNIGPDYFPIADWDISPEDADRVMVLLEGIRLARTLTLSETTTAAIGHAFDLGMFPIFPNLRHLQLCIDNCYGRKMLPHFLTNSKNLEFLQMDKHPEPFINEEEEFILDMDTYGWVEPEAAPVCLVERLREIKMISLKRSEDEEKVIRFLLQHSLVLERMTINFAYNNGGMLDEDTIKEFPRGSNVCQLIFD